MLLGEVAGVTVGVCLVDERSNISFGHALPLFTQSPLAVVFGDRQQSTPYNPLQGGGKGVVVPHEFVTFLALHTKAELPAWRQIPTYARDADVSIVHWLVSNGIRCVPLCTQFRLPLVLAQLVHMVFGIFLLSVRGPQSNVGALMLAALRQMW